MKNLALFLSMAFSVLPSSIGATTISGTVRNSADSTAVVGAKVVLRQGTTRVDSTTTDAFGNYSLLNVTSGNKQLYTTATGYTLNITNTTVDTGVAPSTVNIYIVFTLPGSVSGTIGSSVDGSPIANALVLLRHTSATSAIPDITSAVIDSTRTDVGGGYSFNNLAPSPPTYSLAVSAMGFMDAAIGNFPIGGGTLTIHLGLNIPGSITGSVISAEDSLGAIIGAKIYLRGRVPTWPIIDSTTTDSSGEYSFRNVASGTENYWITATYAGYASVTNANVAVPTLGNATSDFYLALIAPGSISGSVLNAADGATPIVDAKVYLRRTSATSAILDSATIDGSGNYGFDNLVAGAPNYFITAGAGGFQSATNSNVAVPNGGGAISNFFLVVTIPASIEGIVITLPDSLPLPGAKVYLRRSSATSAILDSATTDEAGAYAFVILTPGTPNYFITVSATGYLQVETGYYGGVGNNIAVANGSVIARNFLLTVAVPGTVIGTVSSAPDMLPIEGARVYLRSGSAISAVIDSASTDASGNYTFSNVAPGTPYYWITVSAAGFPDITSTSFAVANDGATVFRNYVLTVPVSLRPFLADSRTRIEFTRMGNQLFVNMGFSTTSRTLKVYDLQGFERHQVRVLAGESCAMVPAAFAPANGYLYQTK